MEPEARTRARTEASSEPVAGRDPAAHRVVVGIGTARTSAAPLAWALELCRRKGWVLDVVTVWPDVGQLLVHEVPGHYSAPRGHAVAELDAALSTCLVDRYTTDVQVHVVNDDPVRALVALSQGAELLVLGAPARGRSQRAGREPVTESCGREAACPLVVVDTHALATHG